MSRYYIRSHTVEAFQLGYEHMPSWFLDAILDNRVATTLIGKDEERAKIDAVIKGRSNNAYAKDGDYIVKKGNDCEVYVPSVFEITFGKVVPGGRLL